MKKPRSFEQLRQMFDEASALSGEARDAWLESACSDDSELLEELRDLLRRAEGEDRMRTGGGADLVASGLSRLMSVQPSGDPAQHRASASPLPTGDAPESGAAASHLSNPAAIPTRFDDYEILEVLGSGSQGVVYRARQISLQRDVALKVLAGLGLLSTNTRERFEREITTLARIRHPNIVKVFGSGTVGGAPYVVMELIDGIPMSKALPAPGQGPKGGDVDRWLRICSILARALDHAHELGVVHRDVKPANILIDARGVPVLLDFGIARDLDRESLTETGDFVGTLAYTAPEQARGERIDRRADVFSLGATLYHLLTGTPPYPARTRSELMRQIDAGSPTRAKRFNKSLSSDLSTVLEHATEPKPVDRYASCADIADDLEAIVTGRPIAARPIGAAQRILRWSRRHPAAAGLIAFACVTIPPLTVLTLQRYREGAQQEFVDSFREARFLLINDQLGESLDLVSSRKHAHDLFNRCTSLEPSRSDGWLMRAESALRLKNVDDARLALHHASQLGATGFYFQRLQTWLEHPENLLRFDVPQSHLEWETWAPIDLDALGYYCFFSERQSLAVEVFLNLIARNEEQLLLTQLRLSQCLHQNALAGSPSVFRDPSLDARWALAGFNGSLKEHPAASALTYNRAILIRDACARQLDLGPDRDALLASAERTFRDQLSTDPNSKAALIKMLGTKAWLGVSARESFAEALSLSDAMSEQEILKLDSAEYSAVIETLVGGGRYEQASKLIVQKKPVTTAPGPFTAMVDFATAHQGKGYGPPSLAELERFLTGLDPGDQKRDHAKAISSLKAALTSQTSAPGR